MGKLEKSIMPYVQESPYDDELSVPIINEKSYICIDTFTAPNVNSPAINAPHT